MSTRVAILDDFQDVARSLADWDQLKGRAELTVFTDHVSDRDALVERLAPFDAVLLMRERTPFPRGLVERLPNLKLICTSGMVNRGIDLGACEDRGIVVCGTTGGNTPVIEVTWALLLALVHHIPTADRDLREGRWQTTLGTELADKTIGVVGLGRVGARVAQIARAFAMNVLAWSPNMTPDAAAKHGATYVTKDELLRTADVVTLHLVLSDRSRGTLGARELRLMKSSAYLINTSRGPLVDEAALIDALEHKRIAGAGLDVFDVEPLPADHPLRRLPNTVLSPHIGYATVDAYRIYYPQMLEDVEAWLSGAPTRRIVSTAAVSKSAAPAAKT